MTKPGLMAGSLFVVVLGMGEFFTERVIGGAQNPMLAGLIIRQIDISSSGPRPRRSRWS